MLALVATVGCVAVLAVLMDVRGCAAAASHGRLEALGMLRARGFSWEANVCARAARGGHLEVLSYAHERGCPWDWLEEP